MISELSDYIGAAKQFIVNYRSATRTTKVCEPFSVFDLRGAYGAGTLAASNAITGVVPVSADDGYPDIAAFSPGAIGYLSRVNSTNTVASRVAIYDRLWLAGTHPYNVSFTYSAQPSYLTRVPAGDYSGLVICVEAVTAFTGTPSFTVTYTNEAGVVGRTTGAIAASSALSVGQCAFLSLAAGDTGVQRIQSITATGATAGTFNISVLRPLWEGRIPFPNDGDTLDMLRTGMPQVFEKSALYTIIYPDGTNSGNIRVGMEIASK